MKTIILLTTILFAVILVSASLDTTAPTTKAELGEKLFFDPILSSDRTISCGSCHKPAQAFADTGAVSRGVGGRKGTRNSPSAMNLSLQKIFFWDGRKSNLEEQALEPISNPVEMNLPIAKAVARLRTSKSYNTWFKKIFDQSPSSKNLAEALAAFERTLETTDSPFDEWKFSGDTTAVSESAKRGFVLFNGKAKCITCHFGADLTTNEFRNIGLFDAKQLNDSGRFKISRKMEDVGRFKVPALRNIAVTFPYMHNGMFRTLDEVIDFYNDPSKIVPGAINRDTLFAKPLDLTAMEKSDLKEFLFSLTDRRFKKN
jgi:cytochrome c peroxidase